MTKVKDFINITDFSAEQLMALLDRAIADKKRFRRGKLKPTLVNKSLGMIFQKPSLRTRVSFEVAMAQLGGHGVYLTGADIGPGTRESVEDIARVLGRMVNAIMVRTFSHDFVTDLGRFAPVPVINGLTDYSHPCQAMADLMTILENFGDLAGRTLVFVGDGNNVARSLAIGCAKLGMKFILACPRGYELEQALVDKARAFGGKDSYACCNDPAQVVENADVIYTDTWVSMGQEEERAGRLENFKGFQINAALLAAAPKDAIVLHCLPAYRGHEITAEAFEAHARTILDEAENRLHFQRTLLDVLIRGGGIE